jgi:hypothetical protein
VSEIRLDFLAGSSVSSRLIEFFGYPKGYSHVASVLEDNSYLDSRSEVLAGVPAGVQIRAQSSESWVRKRRATLQVPQEDYDSWAENLKSKIGMPYDRVAIEAFILGRSKHTAASYICSALGLNAVQHMCRQWTQPKLGYVPFPLPGVPAHSCSPNSLLLILATAGFDIGPEQFP